MDLARHSLTFVEHPSRVLTARKVIAGGFEIGKCSLRVVELDDEAAVADAGDDREPGTEDRADDLSGKEAVVVDGFGCDDHCGDRRDDSDREAQWQRQQLEKHQRDRHPHEVDRHE